SDPINARLRDALVGGLRDHGWEEGKNIVLEERFAGGDAVRLRELAAELVALSVDVIQTAQTQAIVAARAKTATIPIIMVSIADPVGSGLVASLARPGGNITGMANQNETIPAKNLELLKENKPGIKRVGIFFSPDNSPAARTLKAMQEDVAPRLGLTVLPLAVTKPCHPNYRALTFALAGLSPAEHTSLTWSQLPYGGFSLGTASKLACQMAPSPITLRLSLLPAYPSRGQVCVHPSCSPRQHGS